MNSFIYISRQIYQFYSGISYNVYRLHGSIMLLFSSTIVAPRISVQQLVNMIVQWQLTLEFLHRLLSFGEIQSISSLINALLLYSPCPYLYTYVYSNYKLLLKFEKVKKFYLIKLYKNNSHFSLLQLICKECLRIIYINILYIISFNLILWSRLTTGKSIFLLTSDYFYRAYYFGKYLNKAIYSCIPFIYLWEYFFKFGTTRKIFLFSLPWNILH